MASDGFTTNVDALKRALPTTNIHMLTKPSQRSDVEINTKTFTLSFVHAKQPCPNPLMPPATTPP
jgi:hypothetical protein